MISAIFEGLVIYMNRVYTFLKNHLRVSINISPKPENALMMQYLHCTICY